MADATLATGRLVGHKTAMNLEQRYTRWLRRHHPIKAIRADLTRRRRRTTPPH